MARKVDEYLGLPVIISNVGLSFGYDASLSYTAKWFLNTEQRMFGLKVGKIVHVLGIVVARYYALASVTFRGLKQTLMWKHIGQVGN